MTCGTLTGYKNGCRCEDCRTVRREYLRERRVEHGERIRASDRAYYQRTREARLAYQARYREEHRDKRNAQHKLYRAVKTGKLTRPAHCEECLGITDVDAHHEDYSLPLEVRWLCHRCHCLAHIDRVSR